MPFKIMGKTPFGAHLEAIKNSPYYKKNGFENLSVTPTMAEDASFFKIFFGFFNKPKNVEPPAELPHIKTDLKNITSDKPTIVWFGHSSYFIHIDGKNILVDPVFSGNASPISSMVKAFLGANTYQPEDFPVIDHLILTHDHYDHLDYKTIVQLKPKIKQVVCPLGVSSHLVYWGYDKNIITELDWWQTAELDHTATITAAPARHFSGRGLTRGKTLWTSYIFKIGKYNFYLGGDSGYDTHFNKIGDRFGPFDIAILECGQYNVAWPYIHMMPEQVVQAAIDLQAKVLMPVHWGKFTLASHPWDEPIKRVTKQAELSGMKITTPMIGEPVILDTNYPDNKWWGSII